MTLWNCASPGTRAQSSLVGGQAIEGLADLKQLSGAVTLCLSLERGYVALLSQFLPVRLLKRLPPSSASRPVTTTVAARTYARCW